MIKLENVDFGEMTKRVMDIFREICAVVPRGSKKEDAMCAYLKNFVEDTKKYDINLEFIHKKDFQDGKPINNVIIVKQASPGYEDAPSVALQAHLDMVCQKVSDSNHDFGTQPISTEVIKLPVKTDAGEVLKDFLVSKNRETTLGADDGIGVACILAILENKDLLHPQIEAVFTSDEEDGMSGAQWLDIRDLKSKRFINIDAEDEGVLFYGCAGGIYTDISVPATYVPVPSGYKLFSVEISGLLGGHSGLKIGERRANANRLIGRTVNHLRSEFGRFGGQILLADLSGGDAKNAITKKAVAVIAIDEKFEDELRKLVCDEGNPNSLIRVFRNEYCGVEDVNEFKITVDSCKVTYDQAVSDESLKKILTAVMSVPNGVLDMHTHDPKMVETSSNLGVMAFSDGMFKLTCFIRSFLETKKNFVVEQMRMIAESIGAGFSANTGFPEWNPNENSELLQLFGNVYNSLFGRPASKLSVHAGLECGYFFKKYEALQLEADLIAIGPTIVDAHVPTEALQLDTVEPVVKLIVTALANMKDAGDSTVLFNANRAVFADADDDCNCNCML